MRKPFTRREIVLVVAVIVGLLLAGIAGFYSSNLQQMQAVSDRNNATNLTLKNDQLNKLENYNSTICGEYRKLYTAYKNVSAQASSLGSSGYVLPGSAKGQVDECYQPE